VVTVNEAMETDFIDFMIDQDLHFSALGHVTKGELRVDDVSFGFINDVKKAYLTTLGKVLDEDGEETKE
jgi:phosphoribosylformylglycinamidine synthase